MNAAPSFLNDTSRLADALCSSDACISTVEETQPLGNLGQYPLLDPIMWEDDEEEDDDDFLDDDEDLDLGDEEDEDFFDDDEDDEDLDDEEELLDDDE